MSIGSILDRSYDLTEGLEAKTVRRVATPAGQRRFGQPIGSIIVADRRLRNITIAEPEFDGWDVVKGKDGNTYSAGFDDETGKWIATEGTESWDAVVEADSEEELFDRLDSYAGGGKKTPKARGANVGSDFDPRTLGSRSRAQYTALTGKQKGEYNRLRRDGVNHTEAYRAVTKPTPGQSAPKKPALPTPKSEKRLVASTEGERRYGKPIGSEITAADEEAAKKPKRTAHAEGESDKAPKDEKPKPKDKEPKKFSLPRDPAKYTIATSNDINNLLMNWDQVPPVAREKVKERLIALAQKEEAPISLIRTLKGLGDGDGVAEAGEGAGAAMRDGEIVAWLKKQRRKRIEARREERAARREEMRKARERALRRAERSDKDK